MGAANALIERPRNGLKRAVLLRALEIYGERFALPDGRLPATFEIYWLLGWSPDAEQPKPLAPGSASHPLAAALGGSEQVVPSSKPEVGSLPPRQPLHGLLLDYVPRQPQGHGV